MGKNGVKNYVEKVQNKPEIQNGYPQGDIRKKIQRLIHKISTGSPQPIVG